LGGRRPHLEISTHVLADDLLAVVPSGELDLASVGQLADVLREAEQRQLDVQLDLGELTFMDSTGLALLIELAQDARANGWNLRMTDPSPAVARVVAMTRTESALGLD
jgi:anti-sigma B factor antagonist